MPTDAATATLEFIYTVEYEKGRYEPTEDVCVSLVDESRLTAEILPAIDISVDERLGIEWEDDRRMKEKRVMVTTVEFPRGLDLMAPQVSMTYFDQRTASPEFRSSKAKFEVLEKRVIPGSEAAAPEERPRKRWWLARWLPWAR